MAAYDPKGPWETSEARTWVLTSDGTLHTRIGFWIATHAAGLAVVASGSDTDVAVRVGGCVMGLVMTLVWYLSVHSLHDRISRVTRTWDETDQFWGSWLGEDAGDRGASRWLLSGGNLIVHVTPVLFALAWAVLLVFSATRSAAH